MKRLSDPVSELRCGTGIWRVSHMRYAPPSVCKAFGLAMMLVIGISAQSTPTVNGQSPQPRQVSSKTAKSYVCPMHTEVKSAKRGKCPKCGMDLRLAPDPSSSASADSNPTVKNDGAVSVAMTDQTASSAISGSTRKMAIPDVEVLDQHGNQLHFYSDLIKGKTVAINFIFTNCTTICPPLAATFARVQKQMGDKVGRDVHFISISVDPLTDTPERLKAWGGKFKAGAGWTFVTGDKQEIDKLLNALGASVARREEHSPSVIVGNDLKGLWTRTYGLAPPTRIVGLIMNVMEGKRDESLIKEIGKP